MGPWLKLHSWDHLHTQECLSIDGVKVSLTKSRAKSQQLHWLYALSSVQLRLRSARVIRTLAPSLDNLMKSGKLEALWEGKGVGTWDDGQASTCRTPPSSLSRKGE